MLSTLRQFLDLLLRRAGPSDLPSRLVWGGAGLLMRGECGEGLKRSLRRLSQALLCLALVVMPHGLVP